MKDFFKKLAVILVLLALVFGGVLYGAKQMMPSVKNLVADYNESLTSQVANKTAAVLSKQDEKDTLEKHYDLIDDTLSNQMLTLELGNASVKINTSQNETLYEMDELYTGQPIPVSINSTELNGMEGLEIEVNGEPIEDGGTLTIDQLGREHYLDVDISNGVHARHYRIRTLPERFPKIEKIGTSPEEGVYYSNLFANQDHDANFIFKLDEAGEVLFYRQDKKQMIGYFQQAKAPNGDRRDIYFQNLNGMTTTIGNSYGTGEFVVMDENYEVIDRVVAEPSEKYDILNPTLDHHDFVYIDDGHYILLKYAEVYPEATEDENVPETVTSSTNLLATYIQEVKDGEIVFEWLSTDEPAFYEASVESNNYQNTDRSSADYTHVNSVAIDPKDNNLVLSARHLDGLIKLDRQTGDVLWVLGGALDDFGLTDDQKMYRQHDATYTEHGTLVAFDNGHSEARPVSRAVEYTLDEDAKTVEAFKAHGQELDYFGMYTGSANYLEGSDRLLSIGWGQGRNHHHLYSEIDTETNTITTEIIVNPKHENTYRVIKYLAN